MCVVPPTLVRPVAAAEHQIVPRLALALLSKGEGKQGRERDAAALMRLGRPDLDAVTDFDGVNRDVDTTSEHVEILDPQAHGLAPAKAAIGECQD